MFDSYGFRFALCEVFTMAAVLYFLISVLPCRRSKKVAVLIGYISTTVYTAIMLVTGKDIAGDGAVFRSILVITQHIIIPCYLIGDKSWYRYIGITVIGDMGSSCLGSVFLIPFYSLLMRDSMKDLSNASYDMYYKPGTFYLLVIYMILNFLAYFLVVRLLKWLMKPEKRRIYVMNISQGCFIMLYIMVGIIALPNGLVLLQSIGIMSFITELLSLVFIIRGLIWEKTVDAKNREMIRIRENIEYEKYIKIQEKQQRARKILHDLADHMNTVRLLLEKGKTEKVMNYINEIKVNN